MDKRLKVNFCPWSNFGDTCAPYMLDKLNIPFVFTHHTVEHKILMIGSIMGVASRKNTIVWGTGIIDTNTTIAADAVYLAVRGYKTLERLAMKQIDTTNVAIGDPALLLPRIYQPTSSKKYKMGIIPHIQDMDLVQQHIKNHPDHFKNTIVIDPNVQVNMIESFIEQVYSCEQIVSTCLHGIICAHAYNIPVKWMKVSNKLCGDDIKFYDHYSAIGLELSRPIGMISDENVIFEPYTISYNSDLLWDCRPWNQSLSDEYYVDLDSSDWTTKCYPRGYTDKIHLTF